MRKLLLLPIILLACSKEQANKGPYYDQFIGTWKSVNSSEKEEIIVNQNGVIKINFELDRAQSITVKKSQPSPTFQMDGNTWSGASFYGEKTGIALFFDSTGDTLFSTSSAPNIINGQLNVPDKRKKFVRS